MTSPDPLAEGRRACGQQRWAAAYDLLAEADDARPLDIDDLERLAVRAHMLRRIDSGIPRGIQEGRVVYDSYCPR